MRINIAAELLSRVAYKPGWTFQPVGDAMTLIMAGVRSADLRGKLHFAVHFMGHDSSREYAVRGRHPEVPLAPLRDVRIDDLDDSDSTEFFKRVFVEVLEVEAHEAREFFRLKGRNTFGRNLEAPFHPHRLEGIEEWSKLRVPRELGDAKEERTFHDDVRGGRRETTSAAR